jgi:hypothetical protein
MCILLERLSVVCIRKSACDLCHMLHGVSINWRDPMMLRGGGKSWHSGNEQIMSSAHHVRLPSSLAGSLARRFRNLRRTSSAGKRAFTAASQSMGRGSRQGLAWPRSGWCLVFCFHENYGPARSMHLAPPPPAKNLHRTRVPKPLLEGLRHCAATAFSLRISSFLAISRCLSIWQPS